MLRKKIVIASVLKPINDARMYEKIAISLAQQEKYEVHIIGYPAPIPKGKNITFHPMKKYERISLGRIKSYWNITKIILQLKPEVLIVNSVELLGVTFLYKILFGSKILYDIEENYFRNILYQNNFPIGFKHLLAIGIRVKEVLLTPFFDHKLLAEEKYKEELPFLSKNSTILLNKYNPIYPINSRMDAKNSKIKSFLYSGTISKEYGIWEAIKLCRELDKIEKITLKVIGHSKDYQLVEQLQQIAPDLPFLQLNISLEPIPHQEIIESYPEIDYALTPYPQNLSTMNCIPVKFYEYIAHKIPIIIPDYNKYWMDYLSKFNAYLAINYNDFNAYKIISALNSTTFYNGASNPDVYWNSEEKKLLDVLEKL